MRQTALMLSLTLAVGITAGVIGNQVLHAQQEPIKFTTLLKTNLAGIEGKEAYVILVELAPGAASGKHTHPAHELAYTLEGSATLEMEGKPPVSLKTGGTSYQPPGQVHEVKNASQTAPFKALLVFVAEKGQPLTVPTK